MSHYYLLYISKESKLRDDRVDILRFIGLAMIVFAHVGPPGILFQLRNFDVPLMVLVSGMSFGLSYKAKEPYREYVWKRVKRLVFPVWIFLTIYFIAQLVIYPGSTELNFRTILTSYALDSGIGYVWIIKVFLLVAIVSPFLYLWHKNTQADSKYFFVLAICFLIYEFLRYLSLPYIQEGVGKIASSVVLYVVPYAIIFSVGLRMLQMNKKQLFTLSFVSLGTLFFVGLGLFFQSEKVVTTQALKYPPSIYYFSYALFVSSLLWIYSGQIGLVFERAKLKNLFLFIANNSIWVYLWHIPLVKVIHMNFLLKYLIVFIVAVAITYTQTLIVSHLLLKRLTSAGLRKNIKLLLTG